MEKNSKSNHLKDLAALFEKKHPSKCWGILAGFLDDYERIVIQKGLEIEKYRELLHTYCSLILKQLENPYQFESFHKSLRTPIDYYRIGLEIFRPLVDFSRSTLQKKENIQKIADYVAKGENVILYANHQIEADPTMICLMIEKDFPDLAENLQVVAGERVVTDPLAVPFSAGLNLFCIYSKKYFDAHLDRRSAMLEHNKVTMLLLGQHLSAGGKCLYIAPSGGRDRRDENGHLNVAKFDPQSIELLYLLGKKSKKPTHFFPLALSTHDVLPPPEGLQVALGEKRPTNEAPIHIFFGDEIDMEHFAHGIEDKQKKKDARAYHIWQLVQKQYESLPD